MASARAGLAVTASCLLVLLAPLSVHGLPTSPSVRIESNWLVVNNKKYSRKNAHQAWLGRVGRTSGLWMKPVLINFRTSAPEAWLDDNVKVSTTLTLSSEETKQISAALNVESSALPASGDVNITSGSKQNASYVLQGLTFDDTLRIKHWFNDDANEQFKQDVIDMYSGLSKPRIVTKVWVLVKGDAEHANICTGGHLSMQYNSAAGHIGAKLSGSGCRQSTWSFDPETIIAYEASYLQFENMAGQVPRGRVKDIAVDWQWTR